MDDLVIRYLPELLLLFWGFRQHTQLAGYNGLKFTRWKRTASYKAACNLQSIT